MNDRVPGSCWDNPIRYKGYRIYIADLFPTHGYQYEYCHEDYDGAPDANDQRHGLVNTILEAKAEIDDAGNQATDLASDPEGTGDGKVPD